MKNANGLDYFNLGEPLQGISGKVDSSGIDYFNLGEPYIVISSGAGDDPIPPDPVDQTLLQTHGAGAQPISVDTSGRTYGGAALRAYVFADADAAQAAGYVCEGGPAMSVSLITAAQLASGAWKAEGDPSATALYIAPAGTPIEGGDSTPIVQVN